MGTLNPRARGGSSLTETMKARRLREEQLGRQRVTLPAKTPPALPGGPSGLVRANCRSVVLDTTSRPGWIIATADSAPGSWSFFDPNGLGTPGTSPGLVESTNGHFNVTESGWYAVSLRGDYGWSGSAPSGIEVHLNPATTSAIGDTLQLTQSHPVISGSAGYFHASLPAAYIPTAADDPTNTTDLGGVGLLGFEVWIPSGASVSFIEAWIDIVRLG